MSTIRKVPLFILFTLLCAGAFAQSYYSDKEIVRLEEQCIKAGEEGNMPEVMRISKETLSKIPPDDYVHLSTFSCFAGRTMELPRQTDSALFYFERSLHYARLSKRPELVSSSLRSILLAYYSAGNQAKVAATAAELEQLSNETKDEELKIDNHNTLAEYYAMTGLHEKHLQYRLESLTHFLNKLKTATGSKAENYKGIVATDYIKLAELYFKNYNQPGKALEYLEQSRPYISPADIGAKTFCNSLSISSYLSLNDTGKALMYYDSLSALSRATGHAMVYNVLFTSSLDISDYYLKHHDKEKALAYSGKAKLLMEEYAGDPYSVSSWNLAYANILMAEGKYKEALPLLLDAEVKSVGMASDFENLLKQKIADCYFHTGDMPRAALYYQAYATGADKLHQEKVKQSIANAEARYQNKEKQERIENQNMQLDYARKQRLWLIAGLVLTGLVVLLLIIIYRNKKRTADVLNRNNKKLAELNSALEEANRTKAKLFGIISHDLRSPISQVYQFLRLQQLDPDRLNEQQKAALSNKIQSATGSLLETMEDLLLWSKTQMNQFNTEIGIVAVDSLVLECQHLLQLNSDAKKLVVDNNIAPGTQVESDPYFLQTIVRNLLQNAIKASPQGGQIAIGFEDRVLTIRNEGGRFTQAQYEAVLASRDEASLSGLGLRLVAELSEKINARVSFTDEGGDTTCVRLSFS